MDANLTLWLYDLYDHETICKKMQKTIAKTLPGIANAYQGHLRSPMRNSLGGHQRSGRQQRVVLGRTRICVRPRDQFCGFMICRKKKLWNIQSVVMIIDWPNVVRLSVSYALCEPVTLAALEAVCRGYPIEDRQGTKEPLGPGVEGLDCHSPVTTPWGVATSRNPFASWRYMTWMRMSQPALQWAMGMPWAWPSPPIPHLIIYIIAIN